MTITLREKELVQTTWAQVIPISDVAARLFYGKLFELDPGVRPLFTSDMEEQGRKLMQMITVAVQGLDHLDQTLPAVRGLAVVTPTGAYRTALQYRRCGPTVDSRTGFRRRLYT